MNEPEVPPWGKDPLSEILSAAQYNERVSAANLHDVYGVLQGLHSAFTKIEESTQRDSDENRIVPRMLLVRAHSSCLAACRLALSGQLPETYAVLRVGIEQTWYAVHIGSDSAPPRRRTLWLERTRPRSETC